MFTLRGVVAVGVSLALAACVFAAPKSPAKSRRSGGGSGIQGTVVQVHHDKGKGNAGSIEIRRTHHHRSGKKGGKTAAVGKGAGKGGGQTMTVLVNASTRFQRVGGKGGSHVSFNSIRPGERVRVILASGKQGPARVVEILSGSSKRGGKRISSIHRRGGNHLRRSVSRRPRSGAAGLAQAAKHPSKPAIAKHKPAEKKRTAAAKRIAGKKNKPVSKPKTANKPKTGHAKTTKPAHSSAGRKK